MDVDKLDEHYEEEKQNAIEEVMKLRDDIKAKGPTVISWTCMHPHANRNQETVLHVIL